MKQRSNELFFRLVSLLRSANLTISAMESCTGGYFSNCLTNIENASFVTRGGVVAYSNEAKIQFGVSEKIIEEYGVYSEDCAIAMAWAIKELMNCDIGVGITGTFSNVDINNHDSVPGLVYVGVVYGDNEYVLEFNDLNCEERYLAKEEVVYETCGFILSTLG